MAIHQSRASKERLPNEMYACNEPGCTKFFKRQDHLTRHRQNHTCKDLYACTWPGCSKSFVRKDVRSKHIQRHIIKKEKQKQLQSVQFFEIYTPSSIIDSSFSRRNGTDNGIVKPNDRLVVLEQEQKNSSEKAHSKEQGSTVTSNHESFSTQVATKSEFTPVKTTIPKKFNDEKIEIFEEAIKSNAQDIGNRDLEKKQNDDVSFSSGNSPIAGDINSRRRQSSIGSSITDVPNIDFGSIETSGMLEKDPPADLIHWMLSENIANSNTFEHVADYSPSTLKGLLDITPNFIFSTLQTSLSEETRIKMIKIIPSLQFNKNFEISRIESFLDNYWKIYHIQYPILHKPSFSTAEAHPLLLLSMITIGSALFNKDSSQLTADAHKLAEDIAEPLRWLIFSASEFTPTITPWVIQSLLILESYETNCSNRRLHRRAHLHHGLKIQLLRRSPFLGGDPLKNSYNDKNLIDGDNAWKNWIEVESLKRCAFMAFFFDAIHAIIFGRETILYAHQIKLSLPCDEFWWEMDEIDKSNSPSQIETPKFVDSITKLIRKENIQVGVFGRKILLAGLLTIIFQMEQRDMQSLALEGKYTENSWKDTILSAIDTWFDGACHGNCRSAAIAFYLSQDIGSFSSKIFTSDDTTCKLPIYHISQAFLRIKQYDCIIYAGAPNRMNVRTDYKDYEIVQKRIQVWANSFNGKLSLAHAYVLISETLLSQDIAGIEALENYNPASDILFYRPNIIASMLFLIWGYNYCLEGPESDLFSKLETTDSSTLDTDLILSISNNCIPEKINGYTYIKRINYCYNRCLSSAKSTSHSIELFAKILDQIPKKNYCVGLLRLFKDKYISSENQIFREYGRLMDNCIQRSLGKKRIICDNMYEE